jgi:hypothetical protein
MLFTIITVLGVGLQSESGSSVLNECLERTESHGLEEPQVCLGRDRGDLLAHIRQLPQKPAGSEMYHPDWHSEITS